MSKIKLKKAEEDILNLICCTKEDKRNHLGYFLKEDKEEYCEKIEKILKEGNSKNHMHTNQYGEKNFFIFNEDLVEKTIILSDSSQIKEHIAGAKFIVLYLEEIEDKLILTISHRIKYAALTNLRRYLFDNYFTLLKQKGTINMKIVDKNLKIEKIKPKSKGQSAYIHPIIKVIHIPSGIVVSSSEFASSIKNLERCKEKIKEKLLVKAISLAVENHKGQVDKAGENYILHPLTIMLKMDTIEEKTVAVLHDIVEDTSIALKDLIKDGFSENIIEAVDHLTKREGETYKEFINRCKGNQLARKVKIRDVEHNLEFDRLTEENRIKYSSLKKRYEKALLILKEI